MVTACPEKFIRNPLTSECVMINSKKGQQILRMYFNKKTELTSFFQEIIVKEPIFVWKGNVLNEIIGMLYILEKHQNDCIILPPTKNLRKIHFDDLQLLWEADEKKLSVPENYIQYIQSCSGNARVRFVAMSLGIESSLGGHANYLILDKKTNLVEHFEPNGHKIIPQFKIDELSRTLKYFFTKLGYIYQPPSLSCPVIGPQRIQSKAPNLKNVDPEGYCLAWSILYVDLRFSFPDIPPLHLQNIMIDSVTSNPEILLITIRNYASYVQELATAGKKPLFSLSYKEQKDYLIKRLYKSSKRVKRGKSPKRVKKIQQKVCKPGKEISSKSGRCVNKCKSSQRRNPLTGRCIKTSCKPGKEISSKSGRCVNKCKSSQRRNPLTGRCIKKK